MRSPLIVALAMFLLLPLATLAVPTGLNMMPTAEAVGNLSTRFDAQSSGSGWLYVPNSSSLYGTEVGLLMGFEGGIDFVSDGTRYNGKWVFASEGLILPAFAAGVQNVGAGTKSQYYFVGTKTLVPGGALKVDGGFMYVNGDAVTMVGASSRLGPLTFKADKLSGGPRDGQAYSVGLTSNTFTITGTHYDYTSFPAQNTITVSYTYKSSIL